MINDTGVAPDTNRKLLEIVGFSSVQTIRQTYLVAREAAKVEGCFVECGVATGGGSAPMALALTELGDSRTLHLFDSFEGLPHCGIQDGGQIGHPSGEFLIDPNSPLEDRLKTTGISVGTRAQIEENFKKWIDSKANVQFHKGWVQHTLPGIQLAPIAFLRLDVDLYESTMTCLEYLYRQVAVGGYVWLDEGGMPPWIGGRKAYKEFFEKHTEFSAPALEPPTDTGAVYWKVV